MLPEDSSALLVKNLIKWLTMNNKVSICIHYMSGVYRTIPSINVHPDNRKHDCAFCDCAKTTSKGLRRCMKNKAFTIKKAMRDKALYTGSCYLGITEIIKPVFYNDTPVCVIYAGNFLLNENKDGIKDRLARMCRRSGVDMGLICSALETTQQISRQELEEYKEMVEILHSAIKLCIHEHFSHDKKTAPKPAPVLKSRHWVIDLIETYVNQYSDKDIKLSQIAGLYFMNPQYMCRLFARETGMNFTYYLNKVRVTNAKRLLLLTDKSVLDISMLVGFNNVTYFNSVFKKHTGKTPLQFRKQEDMQQSPEDAAKL